jgi:hypothetical protein
VRSQAGGERTPHSCMKAATGYRVQRSFATKWAPSLRQARSSRLYVRTYTAEQMGSPVSMEEQQAVLQGSRKDAAQFGVTIVERPY